jgi:hypothetical protein
MKKALVGAAICAALILGSSGAAFAGEVGGNGKGTQGPDHANSLCVFSGLEDGGDYPGQPAGPGVTQNWGQIPKEFRDQISVNGAARVSFFGDEEGCNAHEYGMK